MKRKTCDGMCIFLLLVLCMSATCFAESVVTKESARTLLENKRFVESYAAYITLLREDPLDDETNMGLARSALATGNLTQAVLTYERLVQRFPGSVSLRRELGQVYKAMGNEDAAIHEMHEAQRLDPATSAFQFQDTTSSQSERAPLSVRGRIGAGAVYDSNFVLGPPQSDVSVGDLEVRLRDEDVEQDAWGAYIKANLDASYRLRPDGPWWLIGDVGAYQKWYIGEDDALTWGRAGAGIYYAQQKFWLSAKIKGEDARHDMDAAISVFGGEGTFTYLLTPHLHFMTRGEYGYRDNQVTPQRSGAYFWIGEYVRILFQDGAYELLAGGRLFHNEGDSHYESNGWEISGQAKFTLPWNSDLRLFAVWQEERYDGPAVSWLDKDRKDDKLRLGVTLTHMFSDTWSMDVSFQHVVNNSNTDWSDYEQNVVSTGLTWSF